MALDPKLKEHIAARVRYYRELGIYDLYRREVGSSSVGRPTPAGHDEPVPNAVVGPPTPAVHDNSLSNAVVARSPSTREARVAQPPSAVQDPAALLTIIRSDLGDCTRCVLHKQGRKQIVFGVGNPHAELMFVGEGPGADEDEQGEPFVGRAGQLLNKMIAAMGLRREDVYIANVVKCRPPGNRTPERDECDTCSPFLLRQVDAIQPKAIVALGAVAAKTLLGINDSMSSLRGRFYDFRGIKLAVTYHPAYLLRDPRQKGEAWKDLQMVMRHLGLPVPTKSPS